MSTKREILYKESVNYKRASKKKKKEILDQIVAAYFRDCLKIIICAGISLKILIILK